LIKFVLFEWDKNLPLSKDDDWGISQCYVNKFQNKLIKLEGFISQQIGKPMKRKIKSVKHKRPFRDDIIWKSQNGLIVDMYMFGNKNYRQINLAIYKE
jgi:hypothetical protein